MPKYIAKRTKMAYISMFKEMLIKSANASQVDYTFVLWNNTLGRFTKKFGNIPDQWLHNSLLSHFFYFLKWCSLFILLFFLFFSPCISHFILPPPFFYSSMSKKGGGSQLSDSYPLLQGCSYAGGWGTPWNLTRPM